MLRFVIFNRKVLIRSTSITVYVGYIQTQYLIYDLKTWSSETAKYLDEAVRMGSSYCERSSQFQYRCG